MDWRARVASALATRPPRVCDPDAFDQHASVSLVLAPTPGDGDDLDLLFIQRQDDPNDHWSGHTAFPGGRIDDGDAGAKEAAERETLEEVGVDLRAAEPLGRLDDLTGRSASLVVSAFVYGVEAAPAVTPNYEVADTRWLALGELERPARHVERDFVYREHTLGLPAVQVFDPPAQPLWGLSYRFLELFMGALARPIPPMPWDEDL